MVFVFGVAAGELASPAPKNQPKVVKTGPTRSRGWNGRGNNYVFNMKNATLMMPLNTMWLKLRAGGATASRCIPLPPS